MALPVQVPHRCHIFAAFRIQIRLYFQTFWSKVNYFVRVIVQLCCGHLGVILGSKGLKLIRLSIKDNDVYVNSYTLGGHGPPAPN